MMRRYQAYLAVLLTATIIVMVGPRLSQSPQRESSEQGLQAVPTALEKDVKPAYSQAVGELAPLRGSEGTREGDCKLERH